MIRLLSKMLRDTADKIDSGMCPINDDEILLALEAMSKFDQTQRLSKAQACDELNMSESMFDTYVRNGSIPKGEKIRGFKEKEWKRYQLKQFQHDQKNISKTGN